MQKSQFIAFKASFAALSAFFKAIDRRVEVVAVIITFYKFNRVFKRHLRNKPLKFGLPEKKFFFGETEAMEFTFKKYGEYMLYITAKDAAQNEYTYLGGIAIDVSYSVKPIICIAGEMQTTAKVNEKIELPEITVYDVKDGVIGYDVYVYAPSGTMTKVEDSFIPASKGEYSVFVHAINSSGNVAVSETFIITVI